MQILYAICDLFGIKVWSDVPVLLTFPNKMKSNAYYQQQKNNIFGFFNIISPIYDIALIEIEIKVSIEKSMLFYLFVFDKEYSSISTGSPWIHSGR